MAMARATPLPALSRLRGMDVCDSGGERIGTVRDALLDPDLLRIRYLAVSVGRLSRDPHLVPIGEVTFVDDGAEEYVTVPVSADHLAAAPRVADALTPEAERAVSEHFARAGDWEAVRASVRARQATPAPTPEIARATIADAIEQGEDPPRMGRPPAR